MKWWLAVLATVVSGLPVAGLSDTASGNAPYVLGPQDGLAIRVNTLRRDTGEIYTWGPLSDDFSVGADGMIFLPIIGQLTAAGRTPEALAVLISEEMRMVANLVELPSTTVEVISYRPVFIMGAVQQPGRYAFQPGMTVLQALGTAEGFARSPDMATTQRDAITASGRIRELMAEHIALQTRLARFTSESEGGEAGIEFPVELTSRINDDPMIKAAMMQATERYHAGREALQAELSAIENAKTLLNQELETLDSKSESLTQQQNIFDEELQLSTDLLQRGLIVSTRQTDAENSRLAIGNSLLDVQLAKLRAQQALQAADRGAIDLRARYRTEALDNLVATREQIEQNRDELQTAQALLTVAMSQTMETFDTFRPGSFTPEYRIVRSGLAGNDEMVVTEDFLLQPGDVLQVQIATAPGL
ncbi:sugar transporter (plasmid) [Paracoccus liaowanqingii]|uniref:Sugar transporter n=1 Tax=Paracoccus liaowanqingii TaxID=2560053 RepID=A0A4Y5STG9_9RHOB|nr:polysaccharide biosynthesis/export family protein [Paracoccus liaowanqingii]QDA36790.1 sugar transporter [Paracoccus liaowanqingii]